MCYRRLSLLVANDAHVQMRQTVCNRIGHLEHLPDAQFVSGQVIVERSVFVVVRDQPELRADAVVFEGEREKKMKVKMKIK